MKCDKCGNMVMWYEDEQEFLCLKCDCAKIAKKAYEYYRKQIKGE